MNYKSDISTKASTNADVRANVGGVNMAVAVNDSTLAKERTNTNEKTVCNSNVGTDSSMEKDKYLPRSMRRLEKLSDLGIDPSEVIPLWEFVPTDKVGDTIFPGPDGATLSMKEAYGVPNAQLFLYGNRFNLADGGDGRYYLWNVFCPAAIRIELTDIHEILAGICSERLLRIPHTIFGYC